MDTERLAITFCKQVQHTYGVKIKIEFKDRPKTKRGLLGNITSVYDPQGIAAPAMLSCKLLHALGWDDPIPSQVHKLSCHSELTGETDPSLGPAGSRSIPWGPRVNIFFVVFSVDRSSSQSRSDR